MGTNAGGMLLSGNRAFLIAEEEWARVVGELGPLMGLGVIALRIGLTCKLGWASFRQLASGDILPWLLLSVGVVLLPQGQWAQPTALGFAVVVAGLVIAALRVPQPVQGLYRTRAGSEAAASEQLQPLPTCLFSEP
jgi:hypothetical protein